MAQEKNQQHQNHAKDNFRDNSSRPVYIQTLKGIFPDGFVSGQVQQSGVVVLRDTPHGSYVAAAVKDPKYILNGNGNFGGVQTEKMIEYSLLQPVGEVEAARQAIELLAKRTHPTMGAELEGFVHDFESGKLVPAQTQIETSKSLREDPTEVSDSIEKQALTRAQMIVRRAYEEGKNGNIVIDSGSPLTFGGQHPAESAGLVPSDHPYIQAMCRIFEQSYFIPSRYLDSRVQQVLNTYALRFGFKDIDAMLLDLGVARVWDIAASHVSLGIPGPFPSVEIGIAIANIFSSDLATIAEFLTQGSPLHAGQIVQVEEGNQRHDVRDVRTLTRYYLRTAYVTEPFINSTDVLQRRLTQGVVEGLATTPDRSAFHNIGPDGLPFVSAHARTRLRGFGDPEVPTARVEFVGGSSTPSTLDVIARDAYLAVLWTGALEAVSNKQSPQGYFSAMGFPSAGRWERQKDLSIGHSIYGAHDPEVRSLIEENLAFLSYMKQSHPHLAGHIDFVVKRVTNLSAKPAAGTIDGYTNHPQGNIAEVITAMKREGCEDSIVLQQLNRHQLEIAKRVIECNGALDAL